MSKATQFTAKAHACADDQWRHIESLADEISLSRIVLLIDGKSQIEGLLVKTKQGGEASMIAMVQAANTWLGRLSIAVVLSHFFLFGFAWAMVEIEPLALGFDDAPGVPGATYAPIPRWAHASNDGRFTWQADLSNGQEGIWVNDEAGTRLFALAGPGATFSGIYAQPSGFINSNGDVTIVRTATTSGRNTDPQDIIVTDGVTQRVVYQAGQQAPGLDPGITIDPGSVGVLISDNDIVSFRRTLSGPGVTTSNDNSWWIGPPDNIQLLIREGDPAPGLPGEFVGGLGGLGIRINDSGYAVINERLASGVVGNAMWAGTPGDLELVAFQGIPAPDTNGLLFSSAGRAVVAETNELVFNATFEDPATSLPVGVGLYRGPRDNLSLLLGPDKPSPFPGEEIVALGSPAINRTGDATMIAVLSDGSGGERRSYIKVDLDDPSQSTVIATIGDHAPGTSTTFSLLLNPQINDRGDIFFSARLTGFGPVNFGHGFWIKPIDGPLQLVAREGQSIDVPTDTGIDTRTIDSIGLTTTFTDEATVAFRLRFTNNTFGLFAAGLTVIPEPSTIVLVDIKPGSFLNSLNLKSKGVLPVAILSTEEFDATQVKFDTLMFGDPLLINSGGTAVSPLRIALEDVSGDGLLDLTLKFSIADLVEHGALSPDTLEGILIGLLVDGTSISGLDSIRIVPPSFSSAPLTAAVPEPSTLALTALGLLGIGWRRRKRA